MKHLENAKNVKEHFMILLSTLDKICQNTSSIDLSKRQRKQMFV